ncbi:unnamed protein product [Sphagnum balticum]
MLATAHAAVSNAASATCLQPSTAPRTATLPPAPTTPGKGQVSSLKGLESDRLSEKPAVHTGTASNGGTMQVAIERGVIAGVQGSAATVVKVEDGSQIVNHSMGTITKGSEEVANP